MSVLAIVCYPAELPCPACKRVSIREVYARCWYDFTCPWCGADEYEFQAPECNPQQAQAHRRRMQLEYPLYDWSLATPAPIQQMPATATRIKFRLPRLKARP